MSMSDPLVIKDQFGIIQGLHMSPIPQTSFLVGTFFAASYSKTALVRAYCLGTYIFIFFHQVLKVSNVISKKDISNL